MSSKPHPEGVAEVAAILDRIAEIDAELPALRAAAARLKELSEEREDRGHRLVELLRSMDLESTGHFGWAGRMVWFLMEMRRQTTVTAAPSGKEPR